MNKFHSGQIVKVLDGGIPAKVDSDPTAYHLFAYGDLVKVRYLEHDADFPNAEPSYIVTGYTSGPAHTGKYISQSILASDLAVV